MPENGDKMLETNDTKADAEQPRAIEASKARASHDRVSGKTVSFDGLRGSDGKVRTGVWDYICVEGIDLKDGMPTAFNRETLTEMVKNFVDRGDLIPIDWNHQSNYASQNGQPAPALGFYGAFAVVFDGECVKLGGARGVDLPVPDCSKMGNGLWGLRTEVTEKGDELLPSFKYLSPTFTPEGTDRMSKPVGYCLLAVAATNCPWQSGTEINFEKEVIEIVVDKKVEERTTVVKQSIRTSIRFSRTGGTGSTWTRPGMMALNFAKDVIGRDHKPFMVGDRVLDGYNDYGKVLSIDGDMVSWRKEKTGETAEIRARYLQKA